MPDAAVVPQVLIEMHGHIAVLRMCDSARRNAMSLAMGTAFDTAVKQLAGTPDLRAVVLCGEGEAFSAGGDLNMLRDLGSMQSAEVVPFMRGYYDQFLQLHRIGVPVIAAVRGVAVGAGLALAVSCDMVVVDETARLAFNFLRIALHPGMASTVFVPRRVGHERAARLFYGADMFSGREAATWGLVGEAVPRDEVEARAMALAEQVAARGPVGVRELQRTMRPSEAELGAGLQREAEAQALCYQTDDYKRGVEGMASKTTPVFHGK